MSIDTSSKQQDQARPTTHRFTLQQQAFFKSEAAIMAEVELKLMDRNPKYNTRASFSAGQDTDISFVDRHMRYLSEHPKLDPRHYLSNLRLMTKLKT